LFYAIENLSKKRVPGEISIDYVKPDSKETVELLKKLGQFRPKLMSQVFHEEPIIGPGCEDNGMLSNLRRIFQSDAFFDGILAYIQMKKSSSIKEPQRSRIKQAFQTTRFVRVSTLQTVLNYMGSWIDSSSEDKFIYYSKSEGRMVVYFRSDPSLSSFEKCFQKWGKNCAKLCINAQKVC
jgi:hypothetical protein